MKGLVGTRAISNPRPCGYSSDCATPALPRSKRLAEQVRVAGQKLASPTKLWEFGGRTNQLHCSSRERNNWRSEIKKKERSEEAGSRRRSRKKSEGRRTSSSEGMKMLRGTEDKPSYSQLEKLLSAMVEQMRLQQ
ncbi:hypothetical protein RB195_022551 [Necator americanus]|uniref:Uncharacterized protein n=1 Tax=Necator americanus TaxID=51031 RepID=A0ABR1EHW5_NECAM